MSHTLSSIYKASSNPSFVLRPIYSGKVSAGQSRFPSPAQDYELAELDLNKRFIANQSATFMMEVGSRCDSMTGIGIYPGSVLIIDKSIKEKSSSIVVVVVDGELMVKRYYKRGNVVKLLSENSAHKPIIIKEGQDAMIWGVVTYWVNRAV